MFDIDFSSKRAKLALRFFTYGVMTVSTIAISTILIFFALGYRLNNELQFSQGGLVQFRSFPDNATITVDGQRQNFRTPNKMNMVAGQHTASMALEGYRQWDKSFEVMPGQLLWLNYARFIPNDVETTSVRNFDALSDAIASPNRRWLLLQPELKMPTFELADMSNEDEPVFQTLALPEDEVTKKDGSYGAFTIVEWDLKSQYVLIKHENADTVEFIRLDRSNPDEATNLSKLFGFAIKEAHFSGNNANVVFANTNGVLRRLDIGGKSASGVLVDNLESFVVYGDGIITFTNIRQPEAPGDAVRKDLGIWRGDKTTIVRSYNQDEVVIFNHSEYDRHEYLAIGHPDSSLVDIIRDPNTNTESSNAVFAQFDVGTRPKWLRFSGNGRMVVAQNNNQFATYDLEEAKSYQKTLDVGVEVTQQLRWLDDFYLWTTAGGTLRTFEFDGANMQSIVSAQDGYRIMLSDNGQRLFSISKDEATGRYTLQASKLTLND
jgi:hypothetical protein